MNRRKFLTLAGMTTGGAISTFYLNGIRSSINEPKLPLYAHRGGAGEYPENTIRAFEEATNHEDVTGIELDVRETADGTLVVFHDSQLSEKTNIVGKLSETNSSEVLSAEVLDSGYTIPSLKQVFDTVPEKMNLLLEIKQTNISENVAQLSSNYDHEVTISSFHESELSDLKHTDVQTAYLFDERIINQIYRYLPLSLPNWAYFPQETMDHVKQADELGCNVIQPRLEVVVRTDIVSEATNHDLKVEPWTMTSPGEYDQLQNAGVDGIITDIYPE